MSVSKWASLLVLILGTLPAIAQTRKQALLVAIDHYPGKIPPLRGVRNDVKRMAWILRHKFGFTKIAVLANAKATSEKIVTHLQHTSQLLRAGDVFLFYFSGYGSYLQDQNGDESDGVDELLCTYDYLSATQQGLSDDSFARLMATFRAGVHVVSIIDCSFYLPLLRARHPAGQVKALPPHDPDSRAKLVSWLSQRKRIQAAPFIDALPAGHVALSAARGYACAYDADLRGRYHGVFTCCLSANADPGLTYRSLIQRTHISCSRLGYHQWPVLSCHAPMLLARIFESCSAPSRANRSD